MQQVVYQSSSAFPAGVTAAGSTSSTGSPRSRSSTVSAPSNARCRSGSSGPQSTVRGAASSRIRAGGGAGSQRGRALGSPAAGPLISSSSRATSATECPIGPSVDRSIQDGSGERATMPLEGLSPTSPQNAAGMRADPPPSVAVAIGTMPADSAAAEPPLDPPGDHRGSQGLRVGPNTRLAV